MRRTTTFSATDGLEHQRACSFGSYWRASTNPVRPGAAPEYRYHVPMRLLRNKNGRLYLAKITKRSSGRRTRKSRTISMPHLNNLQRVSHLVALPLDLCKSPLCLFQVGEHLRQNCGIEEPERYGSDTIHSARLARQETVAGRWAQYADFLVAESERIDIRISEGISKFPPCNAELAHLNPQGSKMLFQLSPSLPCIEPDYFFLLFSHAKYLPIQKNTKATSAQ